MAVGTAGLTAMLAVIALEDHGLRKEKGPVLVTGAVGGVGSVATAILANLSYEVTAVTGRPEAVNYLTALGATAVISREELSEVSRKPLEREMWAGCVDGVAGASLGRILKQMKYGSSVAAIGLAGGVAIEGALITPFILRGVNLLGIDSVMQAFEPRQRAWSRIVSDLPLAKLEEMVQYATLEDLPQLGVDILNGKIKGRVVVDVNAH
jgi:acrylyl-CoA reductase (NADPH)